MPEEKWSKTHYPDMTKEGHPRMASDANAEVALRELIKHGYKFYRIAYRIPVFEAPDKKLITWPINHGEGIRKLKNSLWQHHIVSFWTIKALRRAARKLVDE